MPAQIPDRSKKTGYVTAERLAGVVRLNGSAGKCVTKLMGG